MTLYLGNNELSQKIMLNGVQMPLMNDETSGMMLSNNGSKPYWTYGQITNCLTKIPQDIKLELNNGTITLKAGSKVYNGNGIMKTTTTDITSANANYDGQVMLALSKDYDVLLTGFLTGETVSELPESTATFKIYFNTTDKKCYLDTTDGWQECSFPFAIGTSTTTSWTSIDQVFNGFGFIGNTIIKNGGNTYIFPNGSNDDGSQNNIVKSLPTLTYWTIALSPNTSYTLFARVLEDERNMEFLETSKVYYQNNPPTLSTYSIWYSPNENKWRYVLNDISNGWLNDWVVCPIGTFLSDASGKISTFNFNNTYQLLDKNDTTFIAQQAMPSNKYIDLELGASGSTYTAPANGYYTLNASVSGFIQIVVTNNGINLYSDYRSLTDALMTNEIFIQIKKGQNIIVNYGSISQTNRFRFIYAEGEI